MKKTLKLVLALALALVLCFTLVSCGGNDVKYEETSAESFEFVHGGYAGHAQVTVNADGTIKSAVLHEYVIVEWAGSVAETVIRIKDTSANVASTDANIAGFRFYIYKAKNGTTPAGWYEYTPGATEFAVGANTYKDIFNTAKVNSYLVKDYVAGMVAGENCIVTINGLTVTKGLASAEAVKTTTYKVLDKIDKTSGYMPLNTSSIGYRYNAVETVKFFKENVKADVSKAILEAKKVVLTQDLNIDETPVEKYTAESDKVWKVGDVVTGATWTDFAQYVELLQDAYAKAIVAQRVV